MQPATPRVICIAGQCSAKRFPRLKMIAESRSLDGGPARVLLLESGTGPGGSVNFLRDFLLHVDHSTAQFIVGLYSPNPSKTLDEIRQRGNPVVFFTHTRPVAPQNSTGFSALFDGTLKS